MSEKHLPSIQQHTADTCLTLSRRATLLDRALFDRRDARAGGEVHGAVHVLLCDLYDFGMPICVLKKSNVALSAFIPKQEITGPHVCHQKLANNHLW